MLVYRRILLFISLCVSPLLTYAQITHNIIATLEPHKHFISIEDEVNLHKPVNSFEFFLNQALQLKQSQGIKFLGKTTDGDLVLKKYGVALKPGQTKITITYAGKLSASEEDKTREYARSFYQGSDNISDKGVFLDPSDYWYPVIDDQLVGFTLKTLMPKPWISVSQGKQIKQSTGKTINTTTWQENKPQEGIYLIAGKFTEYEQTAGAVKTMVFLLKPDKTLAQNYLDATAQYLKLYGQLIAPYPYSKFALVENINQTGLGMPSFTLLGSQIIRMPFIIYTSYPHEILHNWWGNSVYADYKTGNWSEGITAYLSDYLMAEQRGQGKSHRRQVLQQYTDFVNSKKDIPLTEFRYRHNSATEAVGYGKALMLFHMLRIKYGDTLFKKALRQFYHTYQFKVASFDDWRKTFDEVTGQNNKQFFQQWVTRTGAPALKLANTHVTKTNEGYRLKVSIQQTQQATPYDLLVPVQVTLENKKYAYQTKIKMTKQTRSFSLNFKQRPLHIAIDPEFDIFRRLDREEIPPALSQAFGDENALIILPSKASESLRKSYEQLAMIWQKYILEKVSIKYDSEIQTLPTDKSIWVLGYENKFVKNVSNALKDFQVHIDNQHFNLKHKSIDTHSDSIVLSGRNPQNRAHAIALIAAANPQAIPGLSRKLPHYRKYSYLVFKGSEPVIQIKGQWPVIHSPMQKDISKLSGHEQDFVAPAKPRPVLAQVPPLNVQH